MNTTNEEISSVAKNPGDDGFLFLDSWVPKSLLVLTREGSRACALK